jgi:hypothetical protein
MSARGVSSRNIVQGGNTKDSGIVATVATSGALYVDTLVPDGKDDYGRHCPDADYVAARFVRELKAQGQTVTAATFTSGGADDINKDCRVPKASL